MGRDEIRRVSLTIGSHTMTATTVAGSATSTARLRVGVVLALVLATIDIVTTAIWGNAPAPVAVNLVTGAVAIATLIGATAAWFGSRGGAWTAVVARIVSGLLTVLALLVPEAPKDAVVLAMSAVQLVLTVVAVVLLVWRQRRA
jgi:hypothetical protein